MDLPNIVFIDEGMK